MYVQGNKSHQSYARVARTRHLDAEAGSGAGDEVGGAATGGSEDSGADGGAGATFGGSGDSGAGADEGAGAIFGGSVDGEYGSAEGGAGAAFKEAEDGEPRAVITISAHVGYVCFAISECQSDCSTHSPGFLQPVTLDGMVAFTLGASDVAANGSTVSSFTTGTYVILPLLSSLGLRILRIMVPRCGAWIT